MTMTMPNNSNNHQTLNPKPSNNNQTARRVGSKALRAAHLKQKVTSTAAGLQALEVSGTTGGLNT